MQPVSMLMDVVAPQDLTTYSKAGLVCSVYSLHAEQHCKVDELAGATGCNTEDVNYSLDVDCLNQVSAHWSLRLQALGDLLAREQVMLRQHDWRRGPPPWSRHAWSKSSGRWRMC